MIEGPSGSGKSDLALRAIEAGWVLVADDRTLLWADEGRLFGRAPEALAGLMEVRGLGVLPERTRPFAQITLTVICADPGAIERMPAADGEILLGICIPRVKIAALEASAPAKLNRALTGLGLGSHPAYQAVRARVKPAWRGRGPLRVQA